MIYEIVLLRELVIVLGGTVFASSAVLTGVMLGLFIGGYWLGSAASRSRSPIFIFILMELAMAATAIYIVTIARFLQIMDSWTMQFVLALLCVIPTSILAGGELPVATHLIGQVVEKEKLGSFSGKLYAADTFGAMIGGLAGPLWLMGTIGALKSTWLAGLLNALSAIVILMLDPYARSLSTGMRRWLWIFALIIIGILGAGVLLPMRSFDIELMSAGIIHRAKKAGQSTRIVAVNETLYQRAIIAEHATMNRAAGLPSSKGVQKTLYINGHYQADTLRSPIYYDETIYLALSSHLNPERVLVIGCGDGGLLRTILADPRVKHLEHVEIDRSIIRLCRKHMPDVNERLGKSVWEDPRVRLIIGDGRRFLRRSKDLYDVIVCDLPGPLEENTSMFYSYEFYQLVRSRLRPGGMFWTESQSPRSIDTPYVVARTVASVFGLGSTRLVRPVVRTQKNFSYGEIVVVASMNRDHLNRSFQEISEAYANLRPLSTWVNPERHVQWLNEGKFRLRWKDYGVSTDDRPVILHIPPSKLTVSVSRF